MLHPQYVIALLLGLLLVTCGDKRQETDTRKLCGTLDGPLQEDSLPLHVAYALATADRYHPYEIMNDTAAQICVWGISEADETPTEGFGIMVSRGAQSTTFPLLRHTRQPQAHYDSTEGHLWLACSAMEGTGVQVERLYRLQFHTDGRAYIADALDPYRVQQAFLGRLGYKAEDYRIVLYIDRQAADTITISEHGMGPLDEEALWLGEQISYDLSENQPRIEIVPGLKFVTGLVLHYDEMPTLSACFSLGGDTVTLSDIRIHRPTKE